jgi:hypothetical protein
MKISRRIKIRFTFFTCIALACCFSRVSGQIVSGDDESKFYAESKQVNQFFRRFNGEEDEKGNRYYPGDKLYRSAKLRKKYLSILFDDSNAGISKPLKAEFTNKVLEKPETNLLDFHSGNWFAEVHAIFNQAGKDQTVVLFMTLEKAQLGSKWVISKAFGDMFKPYFTRDTTKVGRFLHPMSHELDFMNLRKAFLNTDSLGQFTSKKFIPDHLSVLLYAVKNGELTYKSVDQVKFHFFQIDGWYFELNEFNRSGYNTGWLISNLVKLNNSTERDLMLKYLLYEK